ncbi:hypothetical protein [Burkholderia cepacia]|uniref:hypothetical protein n=1 Tax=Burkholderia cepacia TaxID=292 RepID=UPI000AF0A67F|nr:hypothetical protein [Burkholderia cepacia]
MIKRKYVVLMVSVFFVMNAKAGGIVLGGAGNADPSAAVQIVGTNKGVLFPRVFLQSTSDGVTIQSPATGLWIWNANPTLGEGYYFNAGTSNAPNWTNVAPAQSGGVSAVTSQTLSGSCGDGKFLILNNIKFSTIFRPSSKDPRCELYIEENGTGDTGAVSISGSTIASGAIVLSGTGASEGAASNNYSWNTPDFSKLAGLVKGTGSAKNNQPIYSMRVANNDNLIGTIFLSQSKRFYRVTSSINSTSILLTLESLNGN